MPRVWDVAVNDSTQVHDARVAAQAAASAVGLTSSRTASVALVATELATNLLKHGHGGRVLIDTVPPPVPRQDGPQPSVVQIAAVDHGPGIADVTAALRDGFSTAGSLGAGLGTCRRVADDFELYSVPGRGTVALARIGPAADRRRPVGAAAAAPDVRAGGVDVPLARAEHSGDAWAWVRCGDLVTLMLADGLGHGRPAAEASSAAVRAVYDSPHLSPAELLGRLDTALRGTRGAAVAVAQLKLSAGRLRFCGVGNIGARLREGDTWRPLLSRPGIVGAHRPATLPEAEFAWSADRLLVLHSDGLPSRWTPPADPAVLSADPAALAAVIVRDAGSPLRPERDDTAVAVLAPGRPEER
jgi:anti-sigma regulatory factor (Ser/Thr protein kinase)